MSGWSGIQAGQASGGSQGWVEYQPGELPLVLSVPHGGAFVPEGIPDRQDAVVVNDPYSLEMARELAQAIFERTGRRPHLVINHLHRSKLDANRARRHAAQGQASAEAAWAEYHAAIELAQGRAVAQCGWGHYVDLHTHGQPGGWIELGYGLDDLDLTKDDAVLSRPLRVANSSLRRLAEVGEANLAELVRGETSLGGLLQARGYRAVPSPRWPSPPEGYFSGGYSTLVHGSKDGGVVSATQIEVAFGFVVEDMRPALVAALADSILAFMEIHYGFRMGPGSESICSGFADVPWDHPAAAALAALGGVNRVELCADQPPRFCPDRLMSRGQAARFLWPLIHGTAEPRPLGWQPRLVDVPETHPAWPWAQALWTEGYLDGCGRISHSFCPDGWMTRGHAAAAALRLREGLAFRPPAPQGLFEDTPPSEELSPWVEAAYFRGLLEPCSLGWITAACPDRPISRGEMALILAAVLPSRQIGTGFHGRGRTPALVP